VAQSTRAEGEKNKPQEKERNKGGADLRMKGHGKFVNQNKRTGYRRTIPREKRVQLVKEKRAPTVGPIASIKKLQNRVGPKKKRGGKVPLGGEGSNFEKNGLQTKKSGGKARVSGTHPSATKAGKKDAQSA